jgi:hypothetical protein
MLARVEGSQFVFCHISYDVPAWNGRAIRELDRIWKQAIVAQLRNYLGISLEG